MSNVTFFFFSGGAVRTKRREREREGVKRVGGQGGEAEPGDKVTFLQSWSHRKQVILALQGPHCINLS